MKVTVLEVIGAATVLATMVLAIALVVTTPASTTEQPTDAPSGERAEPCDLESDRACNELVDVQGGER